MTTTMVQFVAGVGIIILITLLWPEGAGPWGSSGDSPPARSGGNDDRPFVLVYSLVVASALGIAAYIGMQAFDFDVQMAATGVFTVMGPTTQRKWILAVGRAVAAVGGLALSQFLINSIDADNRLVAKAIAIVIAVLAAFFLEWWAKQRHVESFANPELEAPMALT